MSDSAATFVIGSGSAPWRALLRKKMSAGILVAGVALAGLGLWFASRVSDTLEAEVGHRAATMLESTLNQHAAELETGHLSPDLTTRLKRHYEEMSQALGIIEMVVWDLQGRVLYSGQGDLARQRFPISDELREAIAGRISVGIETDFRRDHETNLQGKQDHLFEIYVPIRREADGRVVAVAEYYQNATVSGAMLSSIKLQLWWAIGLIGLMFSGIVYFVFRNGDRLMTRQQGELGRRLTGVERQLESHRRDAVRFEERARNIEEQRDNQLRQLNADIHDGIGQLLTVALMRVKPAQRPDGSQDDAVPNILEEAMREVRSLLNGTRLSDRQGLPLAAAVEAVARDHEQRTGTLVALALEPGLPDASEDVRIAICRVVREGLHNAFKHAGGTEQRVMLHRDGHGIEVSVADGGGPATPDVGRCAFDGHAPLGLQHLRDRIRDLGGSLQTGSGRSGGMELVARLPLNSPEPADA